MPSEDTDLVRNRGGRDVIDEAFEAYRRRFVLFVSLAGLTFVPAYLIYLPIVASAYSAYLASNNDLSGAGLGAFGQYFLLSTGVGGPILHLAGVLQAGATAAALGLAIDGEPVTVRGAFRVLRTRFWPLLGTAVLTGLLSLIGVCTLFTLNLALAIATPFVGPIVVLERVGAVTAFRRSFRLARHNLPLCLGVVVGLFVLDAFLSLGVQSLLGIASLGSTGDAGAEQRQFVGQQVVSAVTAFLIAPIPAIATTLLYFSLRCQRDGWDLERIAARSGVELAPEPATDGRRR